MVMLLVEIGWGTLFAIFNRHFSVR